MPKSKEVSNHPCHLLSLPSAKRFWCRHCMTVFEDAITRWHHSRSCRYGVVNNFMRRRELEAKALQNTSVLNPVEARLEHSIQMSDLVPRSSRQDMGNLSDQDAFTCFICHQKFVSMEEMRLHVKYPCSSSKIITTHVPHPKHSMPVFIDSMPVRPQWHQSLSPQDPHSSIYRQTDDQQPEQTSVMVKSEQDLQSNYSNHTLTYNGQQSKTDTITPTNIYVNEQGETVIEVENLDLNTEGAELSLAHLLTQLSQQGIVFDKTRSGTDEIQYKQEMEASGASNILYTSETSYAEVIKEDEEEQPTAEDAANTLAQLAGYRSFRNNQQTYEITSSDDKQTLHSVESYSYTDYMTGTNIVSSHSEMDIPYRYEYSVSTEEPTVVDHSSDSLTHCHKSVGSLTYSDRSAAEGGHQVELVEHIYDSSSGKFVQVTNSQHSIEAEEEINCSNHESVQGLTIIRHNNADNNSQDMISQHYSVQINGEDHLIEAHDESVERLNRDVLAGTEVIIQMDKEVKASPNEKIQEAEDFTVPALSLQEIVDSSHLTFEEPVSSQHVENTGPSHHGSVVYTSVEPPQFSLQSGGADETVYVVTDSGMQALPNSTKC